MGIELLGQLKIGCKIPREKKCVSSNLAHFPFLTIAMASSIGLSLQRKFVLRWLWNVFWNVLNMLKHWARVRNAVSQIGRHFTRQRLAFVPNSAEFCQAVGSNLLKSGQGWNLQGWPQPIGLNWDVEKSSLQPIKIASWVGHCHWNNSKFCTYQNCDCLQWTLWFNLCLLHRILQKKKEKKKNSFANNAHPWYVRI